MVTASGSSNSANSAGSAENAQLFAQQSWMDEHPSVNCIFKRCVDIIGACVGLLLTLPIACLVAIANQIYSPGPLFYTQVRCGLNGRPFVMWKFRSMIVGADRLRDT
ncbi:MAG: sugar transferase, partial [Leptolyngbyaceae bacterium]|nr:sugar transferase [Leptolyngbyaceae bacterium]